MNHPQIKFVAKDLGYESPTHAYVFIRNTNEERWGYREQSYRTIFLPDVALNQSITVEWDGLNDAGELMPRGTYTFDILVEQVQEDDAYYIDYLGTYFGWYRSEFSQIGQHDLEFVFENDNLVAKVCYEYEDYYQEDALEVRVDFVGPDLELKNSVSGLPTAQGVPHEDITVYTFQDDDPAGDYRAIFMAKDNHPGLYRDHLPHRVLAVNDRAPHEKLAVMLDPGHGKFWDAWSREGDPPEGPCKRTDWRGGHTWGSPEWGIPPYHEAENLLPIGAHAYNFVTRGCYKVFIEAVDLTRLDEWDLGLYDKIQAIGGYKDTADEQPRYERSLDKRVRRTKLFQAANWKPRVQCVFVSLHTNPGAVTEAGTFRVYDDRQIARIYESQQLGDRITAKINDEWRNGILAPYSGHYQVLWHLDRDLTGDEFEVLEPEEGKRKPMPAVIIEMAHHTHFELTGEQHTLEGAALTDDAVYSEQQSLGEAVAKGILSYAISRH